MKNKLSVSSHCFCGFSIEGKGTTQQTLDFLRGIQRQAGKRPGAGRTHRCLGWWLHKGQVLTGRPHQRWARDCPSPAACGLWVWCCLMRRALGLGSLASIHAFVSSLASHHHRSPLVCGGSVGPELALGPHQFNPLLVLLELLAQLCKMFHLGLAVLPGVEVEQLLAGTLPLLPL